MTAWQRFAATLTRQRIEAVSRVPDGRELLADLSELIDELLAEARCSNEPTMRRHRGGFDNVH